MLTTVEKVIHLQDFDIFANTSTEDLAFLAAITDEVKLDERQVIFKEGDFPDALYMIIEGKIRLTRDNEEVMVAGSNDSFGTWALFDDEPRVATATTLDECLLLRIDKEEFFDFLADNANITQSIIKTLVKRMRGLMGRVR
jgi:CRP-like cAMP-binding protein